MNKISVLGKKTQISKSPLGYKFDKIKNNNKDTTYNIRITVPEFTSICPVTSQPDFATLVIDYIPNLLIVELISCFGGIPNYNYKRKKTILET